MSIIRFLLVLALTAGVAHADAFRDAYDSGMTAFTAKEYAKARAEFLKAYDLRNEPLVLFNIAQTYRYESNYRQAIDYYRKFLAESKIAEDLRKEAQGYLDDLQATLAKQEQEKASENRPTYVDPPMTNDASAPVPETPEQPAKPSRLPAVVVGGVAVVTLGLALGFELSGRSTLDDSRAEMRDQARRDSLYDDANEKHKIAQGLAVAGAAGAGIAVWLFLRAGATSSSSGTAFAPIINGDRIGVAAAMTF